MKKLLPILLALIGTASGIGAAVLLKDAKPAASTNSEEIQKDVASHPTPSSADIQTSYVKLNNQFIVPVIDGERVAAIIVLS